MNYPFVNNMKIKLIGTSGEEALVYMIFIPDPWILNCSLV